MLGTRARTNQVFAKFSEDLAEDVKTVDADIFSDSFVQDTYQKSLVNVAKLWLMSHKYDRVRQPGWAGFFDHLLREYKMDEDGAKKAASDMLKAANGKVEGLMFLEPTMEPLLTACQWNVGVEVIDTTSGLSSKSLAAEEKAFITIKTDENASYTKVSS